MSYSYTNRISKLSYICFEMYWFMLELCFCVVQIHDVIKDDNLYILIFDL